MTSRMGTGKSLKPKVLSLLVNFEKKKNTNSNNQGQSIHKQQYLFLLTGRHSAVIEQGLGMGLALVLKKTVKS